MSFAAYYSFDVGLKEQYPVTEHAPHFDFRTECCEIKRLQISDIYFPLSFDLGEIGIFWRYFYCRWPEDQKMGNALMAIEGLFLLPASIHPTSDNCERNTQK